MDWRSVSIGLIILVVILAGAVGYLAIGGARGGAQPQVVTSVVTSQVTVAQTVYQTVTATVTSTVQGGQQLRSLKVFFFDPAPANPWWDIVVEGVEKAVSDLKILGVNVEYTRFDATTLDKQISQLQQALVLKPDLAVVGTISDAVQDLVKQLRQAGVIVVLVDRDLPDQTSRDLYLGTDNMVAAKVEAEAFLAWLSSKGMSKPWKIVIFKGLPGIPTSYLRYQGFIDALKPYISRGDVQIVEEVEVNPDLLNEVYQKASSIIPKYGKSVTAYMATNLLQALGIVKALQDNNIQPGRDVYVLGFDAQLPDWVSMIAQGYVAISIQQHPFTMGYWAVWTGYYMKTGLLRLPEKAVINTPTYKVFTCNATYSLYLDHFAIHPTEIVSLASRLTPQQPQIQAPGYYSFPC